MTQMLAASPDAAIRSSRLPRLLVVGDSSTCHRLQQILQDEAFQADFRTDAGQALEALKTFPYRVLVTDLDLVQSDIDLLREIRQRRLPVKIIVTVCEGNVDQAVEAIRSGAKECLHKPVEEQCLRRAVERAFRTPTLHDELAELRSQLFARYSFDSILTKNPRMHAMLELIQHVAQTNSTVLIEGETGTGKEQLARAVHMAARHRGGPFIAINCAALPETLLESELFGHEKGSFTTALGQRKGRFELADGGTIFLDEIGDVPAAMQAKLLRVLQERCFERVGGTETLHVDVRVIAASNRSLQQLVREGTVREDLFYRLNVVKLDVPPLRERPEDIPLLATHFIVKYTRSDAPIKTLSPAAMDVLLRHAWPGNVRELENAIERACVTSRGNTIDVDNLPPELIVQPRAQAPFTIDLGRTLEEHLTDAIARIEQDYLRKALEKTQGHIGQCSQICGLSRRSVTVKMAAYDLDKREFKRKGHMPN